MVASSRCLEVLPEDRFYCRSNGKINSSRCKKCMKEIRDQRLLSEPTFKEAFRKYNREFQKRPQIREYHKTKQQNNVEWANSLKSGPCMDCGGVFPPCVMDWDHRDPERKSFSVSSKVRAWYRDSRREDILAEISKCDLVCSNCHRIRTWVGGRRRKRQIDAPTETI